jgi:hypothetical protein
MLTSYTDARPRIQDLRQRLEAALGRFLDDVRARVEGQVRGEPQPAALRVVDDQVGILGGQLPQGRVGLLVQLGEGRVVELLAQGGQPCLGLVEHAPEGADLVAELGRGLLLAGELLAEDLGRVPVLVALLLGPGERILQLRLVP